MVSVMSRLKTCERESFQGRVLFTHVMGMRISDPGEKSQLSREASKVSVV